MLPQLDPRRHPCPSSLESDLPADVDRKLESLVDEVLVGSICVKRGRTGKGGGRLAVGTAVQERVVINLRSPSISFVSPRICEWMGM